jgi:dTDP-4-dehydrorhamnose 3,5-epimerase
MMDPELPSAPINRLSVVAFRPRRFRDDRGWFTESWNRSTLASLGIDVDFCQDNHSYSTAAWTVRGLHFQHPPFAQAKLVRCTRGRVFDVAVDIRRDSPTYGQHVAEILSAEVGEQLFIPEGYAHGFMTLEDDCEVQYKVSAPYAVAAEGGIAWDDPELAIAWPQHAAPAQMSQKDAKLGRFADLTADFAYNGTPLGPIVRPTL